MNKLFLLALGFVTVAGFSAITYALDADLRAVQAGDVDLVCVMKDGERVIDGSKVNGRIDGNWTFEGGGYAGNCEIIKSGISKQRQLQRTLQIGPHSAAKIKHTLRGSLCA